MASIFGKDPTDPPVPAFARERIEKEIEHLKKPQSTRSSPKDSQTLGVFVSMMIGLAIFGLYAMDPFLFAWYKGDAIRAYLYLHSYDTGQKAQALAMSGIFTPDDLLVLNQRQGTFQDYYPSRQAAYDNADAIINFMKGVAKFHDGPYDALDPLGKVRYTLFCRWGLIPPTQWAILNPKIKDQ